LWLKQINEHSSCNFGVLWRTNNTVTLRWILLLTIQHRRTLGCHYQNTRNRWQNLPPDSVRVVYQQTDHTTDSYIGEHRHTQVSVGMQACVYRHGALELVKSDGVHRGLQARRHSLTASAFCVSTSVWFMAVPWDKRIYLRGRPHCMKQTCSATGSNSCSGKSKQEFLKCSHIFIHNWKLRNDPTKKTRFCRALWCVTTTIRWSQTIIHFPFTYCEVRLIWKTFQALFTSVYGQFFAIIQTDMYRILIVY
jgi:hypothetical protein